MTSRLCASGYRAYRTPAERQLVLDRLDLLGPAARQRRAAAARRLLATLAAAGLDPARIKPGWGRLLRWPQPIEVGELSSSSPARIRSAPPSSPPRC